MAYPGSASSDFERGSSALRILHVGHRTSFGATLADDGFTQDNPVNITATATVSDQLGATPDRGVLGGSVAFTRPDEGNGIIGGPPSAAPTDGDARPVGLFINNAAGNAYENSPAVASGNAPYVSSQGTYGCALFETQALTGSGTGSAGDDILYEVGDQLWASQNGFLTTANTAAGDDENDDIWEIGIGPETARSGATMLGIVRIVPDSVHDELVFDLRV